ARHQSRVPPARRPARLPDPARARGDPGRQLRHLRPALRAVRRGRRPGARRLPRLREVPAPPLGPARAGPHRRLRAAGERDPARESRPAARRAALPAHRLRRAARLPAPRSRARRGRGGRGRPLAPPPGRRLGRAPPRRARARGRPAVPDARPARRRALPLARRSQLRGAGPRVGAGARVPRAPPPAQRAGLRLLPVTARAPTTTTPTAARRAPSRVPRGSGMPSEPLWYKDAVLYEIRVG